MKVTVELVRKLRALAAGASLPISKVRGEWADDLFAEGILFAEPHGSRRTVRVVNRQAFLKALPRYNELLTDLNHADALLAGTDTSRGAQATVGANSKLVRQRSCPGFAVNAYEPIECRLNGHDVIIEPPEGSFMFVASWTRFEVPHDVVIVGVENMANFIEIRLQKELFEREIGGRRLLFVARYPQSADLRRWLSSNENDYVHYGDFDLAGINIYLTEFLPFVNGRGRFLIPGDIAGRLSNGSRERYLDQYARFANLISSDSSIQLLIDEIHRYRRCCDQECYINSRGDKGTSE